MQKDRTNILKKLTCVAMFLKGKTKVCDTVCTLNKMHDAYI